MKVETSFLVKEIAHDTGATRQVFSLKRQNYNIYLQEYRKTDVYQIHYG